MTNMRTIIAGFLLLSFSLVLSQNVTSQTNTPDIYLIFPKDAKDPGNAALTTDLQQTFGSRLTIDSDAITGIDFWAAPLNPSQVAKYEANPLVCRPKMDIIEDADDISGLTLSSKIKQIQLMRPIYRITKAVGLNTSMSAPQKQRPEVQKPF